MKVICDKCGNQILNCSQTFRNDMLTFQCSCGHTMEYEYNYIVKQDMLEMDKAVKRIKRKRKDISTEILKKITGNAEISLLNNLKIRMTF